MTLDLTDYLDNERWLLQYNVVTNPLKNDLFSYGALVHVSSIQSIDVDLQVEKKLVHYKLYVDTSFLKKYNKFKQLSTRTDLIGMFLFKRMIKTEGNLNFLSMLQSFVRDRCGEAWSATLEVLDQKDYKETPEPEQDVEIKVDNG